MADITPDTGKKNTETAVPALTIEGLSSGNSATRDSSDFTGRGDSSQGPDFGVTNEVMKTAQAAGGGSSAQASREMEVAGIVPAVAFMGDGFTDFAPVMEPRDIIEKYASAQDKTTFNDFDALAEKTGAPKFTDQQKIQFMNMPEDQKQMFRTTLEELGKLSDNKISPAQYVSNTLMNAAKMAEANGRPPDSWNIFHKSSQMYYRDYVGMVFSEPPLGFTRDLARGLAGTAFNLPGSGLENIYKSLTNKPNAGDSFNPNVVDVEVTNSITHHHRELLLAGYNNGRLTADLMNRYLDDPKVNPGDVRNGYFSSMIGSALFLGKISPTEAAQMTDWAYTRHGGTQPPWGDTSKPDSYLSRSDYDINKWLKAFKRRER